MVVYDVIFSTSINAKSKADMERKAEKIGELFSKSIHKTVVPVGYVEKEKLLR